MSEDTAPQHSSDDGAAESEMSKLKRLPDSQQDIILGWLTDTPERKKQTLEEARNNILLHFQIDLGHDSQLSRWRVWYQRKLSLKAQNSFAEFVNQAFAEGQPSVPPERVREWQLRCLAELADSHQSPDLMLALAKELRQGETLQLAKDKWREAAQKKLEAGLQALHEEIKNNPRALELFQELQTAVEGAK